MGVRFKSHRPPRQEGGAALQESAILEMDYPRLGKYAEDTVKGYLKRINVTRIRRLHQEVVRIRDVVAKSGKLEECRKMLLRLRYLLAYTYGRLSDNERGKFKRYFETLKRAIDSLLEIQNPEELKEGIERLHTFSEAVVAYHKYYEEKERQERRGR